VQPRSRTRATTVRSLDELDEPDSHTSLWPPGVRCVTHFSDGRTSESTYVTWYELTMALLVGAAVWLACAAVLRTSPARQLMLGLGTVVLLFVVANVAFFL